MNTKDKQKLVDAINCKFPQNNIIELYYDIGIRIKSKKDQ